MARRSSSNISVAVAWQQAIFHPFRGRGHVCRYRAQRQNLGHYDIGRTTQTVCITDAVRQGADNELTVRVSPSAGHHRYAVGLRRLQQRVGVQRGFAALRHFPSRDAGSDR